MISRISAARPKIADYPFTTLAPNLGVVRLNGERSFVVADVPGLIAGAHEGHGLGDRFLRHIERTKVLVHLVDVSSAAGRDPVDDFDVIMNELRLFDPEVAAKPQIVAANKIDALDDADRLARLERHVRERGLPCYKVSGATGEGIDGLLEAMWREIAAVKPAPPPVDDDGVDPSHRPGCAATCERPFEPWCSRGHAGSRPRRPPRCRRGRADGAWPRRSPARPFARSAASGSRPSRRAVPSFRDGGARGGRQTRLSRVGSRSPPPGTVLYRRHAAGSPRLRLGPLADSSSSWVPTRSRKLRRGKSSPRCSMRPTSPSSRALA